jgi:hypothetical protein
VTGEGAEDEVEQATLQLKPLGFDRSITTTISLLEPNYYYKKGAKKNKELTLQREPRQARSA